MRRLGSHLQWRKLRESKVRLFSTVDPAVVVWISDIMRAINGLNLTNNRGEVGIAQYVSLVMKNSLQVLRAVLDSHLLPLYRLRVPLEGCHDCGMRQYTCSCQKSAEMV